MGMTQIGGGSNNNDRKNDRDNNNYGNDRGRERSQEDRDRADLRDASQSLRQTAANPFGTAVSTSRSLGALNNYTSNYVAAKTRGKSIDMKTFVVEEGVAVPSVVIAAIASKDNQKFVISHAIMLVNNAQPPAPLLDQNIQGIMYRDNTTWADAYDDKYQAAIVEVIERDLAEKVEFISAGATAVDYTFIPTEKLLNENNFQSLQLDNLILNVMSGIEAVRAIESDDTSRDIKPSNSNQDAQIVADVSLQPSTSTQPNGDPLAEDFLIKLSEVPNDRRDRKRNEPRSLNQTGESNNRAYGAVSGRIDFKYVEPVQVARGWRPQPGDSACFIPEFIIAGFDVLDMQPSLTLMLQLIASVGILDSRNPPFYLDAFLPANLINNSSRNLGALQAEMQDPETGQRLERLELKPSTDMITFQKFVTAAIQEKVSIAIEIPTQGPLVGLLNTFDQAVDYNGREGTEAAYFNGLIVEAADVLTEGAFSDMWTPGTPVMLRKRAIIPTGYWIDGQQNKRDSREFGYLYYANLDNPQEAYELSVQYDKSFDIDDQLIAAAERRRLIEDVQGSNFVQTDNVSRVYFNPEFFACLLDAMNSSGMAPAIGNAAYAGRGQSRRRVDDSNYLDSGRLENSYQRYNGNSRDDRGYNYNSRGYGASRNWRIR